MTHGTQNSQIEEHLGVIRNLLDDTATLIEGTWSLPWDIRTGARKQLCRDYTKIVSRARHEGLAFLTITLPAMGKWYDKVLSGKPVERLEGFAPYKQLSAETLQYPVLLHTYMDVLTCCGVTPRDRAVVIRAFRSVLFLYYKLEVPLTDDQRAAALVKWKECESELELHEFPDYYCHSLILMRDLISLLMSNGSDVFTRIHPRHGPGAVAGGEAGDEKWETINLIPGLNTMYPRAALYAGIRSVGEQTSLMAEYKAMWNRSSTVEPATSKLLFVPKDSRGPRTISCEPKELMFVQQGIARNLMRDFSCFSYGRIQFHDQEQNAKLALASSRDQAYATVDLKDASDRVTLRLVDLVFPTWAMPYLKATRSTHTLLPDGTVYGPHQKYAPMGSALCFPIEAAIFWAIGVVASHAAGAALADAKRETYVFGDDVIIRPQAVGHFVNLCEALCLRVNVDKTYVDGPFRESCGMDALYGERITPLRIKKDLFHRSLDGTLATSMCKLGSRCFADDYRKTGEYVTSLIRRQFPGVPVIDGELPCLHIRDEQAPYPQNAIPTRVNHERCCLEGYGWVVSQPSKPTHLDGLPRLLKNLYGFWGEHDPSQVVDLRATKIRKRNFRMDWQA